MLVETCFCSLHAMMLWSIFSTASGGWLWTFMTWYQYLYLGDSLSVYWQDWKAFCERCMLIYIFYKRYVRNFAKYDEWWPSVLWMQRGRELLHQSFPFILRCTLAACTLLLISLDIIGLISKVSVIGWILSPTKDILKPCPPVPQNVSLFGNKATANVIS